MFHISVKQDKQQQQQQQPSAPEEQTLQRNLKKPKETSKLIISESM